MRKSYINSVLKKLLLVLALLLIALPCHPVSVKDKTVAQINLLVTSDLHGWLTTQGYRKQKRASGLLHLAPIIKKEKSKHPELVLIDAGDLLQGSPLSHYAHHISSTPLEDDQFFRVFNQLNYDAAVVGNHDLSINPLLEKSYRPLSQFTWLAANLTRHGKQVFSPYKTITRKNIRIVILGFTSPGSLIWTSKMKLDQIQIGDINTSAKMWISHIKKTIPYDLLIGVFHSGLNPFRDAENSKLSQIPPSNDALRTLQNSSEFDLIITGHDHRLHPAKVGRSIRYIKGTPTISAGKHGEALIKVIIKLKKQGTLWKVTSTSAKPIFARQEPSIYSTYHNGLPEPYTKYISEKLPWRISDSASSKSLLNCFNHLLSLSQIKSHEEITAFPSVRLKSIKALQGRQLTRKHFFNLVPYDNKSVKLRLSQRDLFLLEAPPSEYGFKRTPFNRKLQLSNRTVEVSGPSQGFLDRGAFLRQYSVLVTDYHYTGGGGIVPMLALKEKDILEHRNSFQRNDLYFYLKRSRSLPSICNCLIYHPEPQKAQ